MSEELDRQIYNNLNLKETDELIEIWQTNNHNEWSDSAFEAIQKILIFRTGELPQPKSAVEKSDVFPEDENEPVFYKPKEVFWLETWLNRAAILAILVSILKLLIQLPSTQSTVFAYFRDTIEWYSFAWFIAILIASIVASFQIAVYYFCMKALGYILKILMEMEFTSRGVKKLTRQNDMDIHRLL
jgi:hypothetical protein